MKLLVSIHDVTPAHGGAVQRLWTHCASIGICPALLVVPNWHGEWPLHDYRLFTDWLCDCEARGAEILLHGERHDEHATRRELADDFRAFGRSSREAEFLTLDYPAARDRIDRGLRWLRRFGLSPIGFVPPAWLARRACAAAIGDAGLAISEDSSSVTLHRRATRLPSPVIRWSAQVPWRAQASALVARASPVSHRQSWLVRIALHPLDIADPVTWDSVRTTLDHWRGIRHPWRYGAL